MNNQNEAPSTLRSGYLLPALRRERNPSEAKYSSLSSAGLRPGYFAKGDKTGGIESTLVYWLAVEIFNLTNIFCERYVDRKSRTYDQMVQAARSCKQNLVEGSLENSAESNLKLTGISRASFGELVEDYKDFLWKNNFKLWEKNDPRVLRLRGILINPHETHGSHDSRESNGIAFSDAEAFANLMITLCTKEGFLMDRFLEGIKQRFVREGGFKENLFKERMEFKRNQQ